jgi:hypothetical protein
MGDDEELREEKVRNAAREKAEKENELSCS